VICANQESVASYYKKEMDLTEKPAELESTEEEVFDIIPFVDGLILGLERAQVGLQHKVWTAVAILFWGTFFACYWNILFGQFNWQHVLGGLLSLLFALVATTQTGGTHGNVERTTRE